MSRRYEVIREAIMRRPHEGLKAFREWYEKFDADEWDRQISDDAASGKLDDLANSALAEHESGKSKRL